jgi:ATP-dependent Clp endopeptidase proteolytic subunit ClpP
MPKLIDIKNVEKRFEITNKADSSEILLYGAIGESFFDDAISAKAFSDELKKIPASVKNITLRVNSPGGSVFDGMTIYERLKNHPAKVTAYVDGLAASIASVIIMAADEVIVGDGAMVMIHKPMVGTYGNSMELERMIDILDKIENQMVGIYAKKTGQTRAEISAALAAETWYTADEAIELGIANRKFEAKETLHIAASMIENCTWFRNKPHIKNKNDLVREKLKEFNNKAKEFLNSNKK